MGFTLLWLIQDLLTVLLWRVMQIPEIFLLGVVYRVLTLGENDDRLWAIWAAFVGGLLWDLRWIGFPGFFTLGYVTVVLLVLWVWSVLPAQGRTPMFVFILLEASQIIPPLLPVLILGDYNIGTGFFLLQQLCALPALLICIVFYRNRFSKNA